MPARYTRVLSCLAALLLLGGCETKHYATPEVRIAVTLGTFGHAPILLAHSEGYFEQEGVRVTLSGMAGSAKIMEAVVGGSADIGASVGIGLGGSNVAAIENGRVDVAVTSPANLELLRKRHPDLKVLFDPPDSAQSTELSGLPSYPSHTLGARAEWLQQNPEAAGKVARAVVRGIQYLLSHPVAETLSKLPPQQRGPDPEADAAALKRWLPLFSRVGRFPERRL